MNKAHKIDKWAENEAEEYTPEELKIRYKAKVKKLKTEIDEL